MSNRNGDKARLNRLRKQKLARRLVTRAIPRPAAQVAATAPAEAAKS